MNFKFKNARVVSLLMIVLMVLSSITVFADGTPSIDPSSASVEVGKTVTLSAKDFSGGVTWTSSDESVATVSAGTVTGVAAGSATITATSGDESATAAITVTAPASSLAKATVTLDKKYKSGLEAAKDNGYYVKWNKVSGATGYQMLQDGKALSGKLGEGTTSYEVRVPSGKHTYQVKAFGANGATSTSDAKSVTISGVITSTQQYTWWCVAKKNTPLYKSGKGGAKAGTVAKGTKMTAIGRYPKVIKKFKSPKRVQVRLPNGKVGWVAYKSLSGGVKPTVNVKQDYSRSLKEYMVNSKNFKEALKGKTITSKDNTLVWACLYTQRAYTFKRKNSSSPWYLVHTDRVTTGKFSHPTRSSETSGIYTIKKKKAGKVWMVQENGKRYYFTNASYVTNGISFHTGTWWANGKTRGKVVASGKPGTYGCIRMYTDGAKYIFNQVTTGKTGVIITRLD